MSCGSASSVTGCKTSPPIDILERRARDAFSVSMFLGDGSDVRKAWARNLYRRQCEFAHARGNASNAALWDSNGPIYSAKGFRIAFRTFLETHCICFLLAKFGDRGSGSSGTESSIERG